MRIRLCESLRSSGALCAAMGAVCRIDRPVLGIATDSREVQAGDLFVALEGAHTSGRQFVDEALMRGAVGVLGEDLPPMPPCALAIRQEPVAALLRVAAWRRAQSGAFVVAVSGSTGKTTAKEAIATVLREKGSVCQTEGNFNSTIGLPLTLLSFEDADFFVVELGVSHAGEMLPMASAVCPDLALLTNVGTAHMGNFGGFDALLREKAQIAARMSERGLVLIPDLLPAVAFPCEAWRLRTVGQSGIHADFYLENIRMSEKGVSGDLITPYRVITNLEWPVAGRIGASALTTVGAACVLAGCDDEQLRRGLCLAGAHTPRLRTFLAKGRMLIDDCYNASPESVIGAIEVLSYRAEGREKVVVLGDMLELGEQGDALHRAIGASLPSSGISMLFTYGEKAKGFAAGARMGGMTDDTVFTFEEGDHQGLAEAIDNYAPPCAAVLFKGSGRMKMSRVLAAVRRGV